MQSVYKSTLSWEPSKPGYTKETATDNLANHVWGLEGVSLS